jgi:hypothetical protein
MYAYVGNDSIRYVDSLGLQIQVIEEVLVSDGPVVVQEASALAEAAVIRTEAAAASAEAEIASLMQKARELYPKLCNKFHWHHDTPKYLGGDPNGPLTLLEAPYHQLITNAFRAEYQYGQSFPDSQTVRNIVNIVYSKYPLPK